MMTRFVLTAMISSLLAGTALAQCSATKTEATLAQDSGSTKKACCLDDKSGKTACAKTCSSEAVAALPTLKYRVGDETVCCPTKAKELAKGDEKAIQYVVAGKTFEKQSDANAAYLAALDDFRTQITTVKYVVGDSCVACPVTAGEMAKKEGKPVRYRLVSFTFDKEEDAKKAAEAARAAADKIEMKMVVGDKAVSCPVSAKEMASKEGKQVEYVVGESKTCCDQEAKLALARARAAAALAVVEKAAQPKA